MTSNQHNFVHNSPDENVLETCRQTLAACPFHESVDIPLLQMILKLVFVFMPKTEQRDYIYAVFNKLSFGASENAIDFLRKVSDLISKLLEHKDTSEDLTQDSIQDFLNSKEFIDEMNMMVIDSQIRDMSICEDSEIIQRGIFYIEAILRLDDFPRFLETNPLHLQHVVDLVNFYTELSQKQTVQKPTATFLSHSGLMTEKRMETEHSAAMTSSLTDEEMFGAARL